MQTRILRSAIALVLLCGCQDIVTSGPGPVADLTGEWDFAIQLPGDEGGTCDSYGAAILAQQGSVFTGTATRFAGNCSMPPLDSVTAGTISDSVVRFTAGACAFEGALASAGPDSVAGVLTCAWAAGTWSAARVGAPSELAIDPGDRTLALGGSQVYVATLRDAQGHVLYGRPVTWTTGDSAVALVGGSLPSVTVVGAAPGTAHVIARSEGISASVTIVVATAGFVHVGLGAQHSCGLSATGVAWCWGDNADGMLGTGDTVDISSPGPVAGGHTFTVVAGGRWHTCALDAAGAAWCWGYNGGGWLGDGTRTDHLSPAPVSGGVVFASLVVGDYHTCALTAAGEAWCWGGNGRGQLGDSTHFDRVTPVRVVGGHVFVELAVGQALTCGRDTAGAAWCWGTNDRGQEGTGSTDSTGTAYPSPVAGAHAFISLAVGRLHACGVDVGGAAWCWGAGVYGQTGLGNRTLVRVPSAVTGGIGFASIAATSDHTCGFTGAGALWCWGSNGLGQLGVASPTESDVPLAVSGGHLFGSMSTGETHTCALDVNAVLWCWGGNWYGQLGDGTRTDRNTPVRVLGQP